MQQAESRYVRDGCNAAAKRGERLTSACRAQARVVVRAGRGFEAASNQAILPEQVENWQQAKFEGTYADVKAQAADFAAYKKG